MIKINNLKVGYGDTTVLKDFSVNISKGENVVFTGESGAGKTTLLNSLMGFVPFQQGSIEIDGQQLSKDTIQLIRRKMAYLPQELNMPYEKVESVIFEPFTFKQNKKFTPERDKVKETLSQLGLQQNVLQKDTDSLSGGQKQRILLASVFLLQKPLVILDEPTTGLDERNIRKIVDWITKQKHVTILATSHNQTWIEHSDKQYNIENHG
ncbi:MAG: ABC transporter ATP-binding protein [Bacteroidales bacterium]